MDREIIIRNADILKGIANPIRLCLVKKIFENGSCNVSFFTDCMEVSQSNISQHLAKMRDLGILDYKKDGKNVNYFIKNEKINEIIKVLFKEEK
ncbi:MULTISPECIES: helix-turn-helix transcriptional regulator [Peptoniphilus]|uniref:ArsR/SmtB family transcription factor n=1 Tax=Peptoniphilus TaxID=162289 RepID=UPI0002F4F169|nr:MULTISPECIES: metalloregulator ArsR/SmtB family transcription factor [Peptoniphilus]